MAHRQTTQQKLGLRRCLGFIVDFYVVVSLTGTYNYGPVPGSARRQRDPCSGLLVASKCPLPRACIAVHFPPPAPRVKERSRVRTRQTKHRSGRNKKQTHGSQTRMGGEGFWLRLPERGRDRRRKRRKRTETCAWRANKTSERRGDTQVNTQTSTVELEVAHPALRNSSVPELCSASLFSRRGTETGFFSCRCRAGANVRNGKVS